MITEATVLILGAGASMPYEFPSGSQLRSQILDLLRNDKGSREFPIIRAAIGPQNAAFFPEFGERFDGSQRDSVDEFLEHNRKLIPLGKALIAHILLYREKGSLRFLFEDQPLGRQADARQHWYRYLYNQMGYSPEEFKSNELSILTYNYDRSLEHFLSVALENDYRLKVNQVTECLESIPIIHIHGSLGEHPLLTQDGRINEYGRNVTPGALSKCVESMRIVHDDIDQDPTLTRANELLVQAKRICFLGFGYHPINLSRLLVLPESKDRDLRIYGTTFGMTRAEARNAVQNLEGGIMNWNELSEGFRLEDSSAGEMDTLTFLRKVGILF